MPKKKSVPAEPMADTSIEEQEIQDAEPSEDIPASDVLLLEAETGEIHEEQPEPDNSSTESEPNSSSEPELLPESISENEEDLPLNLEPEPAEFENQEPGTDSVEFSEVIETQQDADTEAAPEQAQETKRQQHILTIENRDIIATPEDRAEELWHEIQNVRRTRKILTGTLSAIEQPNSKKAVIVVYYKSQRIAIPMSEMMIDVPPDPDGLYGTLSERQSRIANSMLGADIDFIIKGISKRERIVVASRKEAMLKKRKRFYLTPDSSGLPPVHEGRGVQARVVAVNPYNVRVDIFGITTEIRAENLSWEWIGDVSRKYSVGDKIIVRVNRIEGSEPEELKVYADVKSLYPDTTNNMLQRCSVRGKYIGTVTNVHHGVVYLQLNNGVNAVAHTCYDVRTPGKNDTVAFVVTTLDTERNSAVGIITKVIRQNI